MKHVTLILALALLTGCAGDPVATRTPTPTSTPGATVRLSPVEACVNINTANGVQLESLPGIGPTLAWRIAQYIAANGPFETIEDLQNVEGISPDALERLRPHICLE